MDTNEIMTDVMDVTEGIVTSDAVATSSKGKGVIGLIVGVALGVAVPKIYGKIKAKRLAKQEARAKVDDNPGVIDESEEDLGV